MMNHSLKKLTSSTMLNIGQREVDRLKCHISCKFKDKLLTQTCNKSNPEE